MTRYDAYPEHPLAGVPQSVLDAVRSGLRQCSVREVPDDILVDPAELESIADAVLIQALPAIRSWLSTECAALAAALAVGRHEFSGVRMEVVTRTGATQTMSVCVADDAEGQCRRAADHPVHQTPAAVRAKLRPGT